MNRLIWLGGVLPLFISTASSPAQPPPRPGDPAAMFRTADTNRDGSVDKDEFKQMMSRSPRGRGNAEFIDGMFNRLDTNGDGKLSQAEFARMAQPRRPGIPGRPRPRPEAEPEKPKIVYPAAPSPDGVAIMPTEWNEAEVKLMTSSELDRLMAAAWSEAQIDPAPVISDEEFIRRLYLDLTGELPKPATIVAFVQDSSSQKRSELIDRLLESSSFAAHQSRWWRDIMLSRATDDRVFVKLPREVALERWLREKFADNSSWSSITRDLLTANGTMALSELAEADGASGFLLSHARDDGPVERANDTARVFLGINVQCAQCHDHPEDIWKRVQFHELAAYFGRTQEFVRNRAEQGARPDFQVGFRERRFGEYGMPDQENPNRKTPMQPVFFLTGERPGMRLSDVQRRTALADAVTAPSNFYFHAAFVNRIWDQLMGRPFTALVDNLGPLQPTLYSEVLTALAVHFRATDHDIRELYRVILNSEAYQREFRMEQDFAGKSPAPVAAEGLWVSLTNALGLSGMTRGFDGSGGFAARGRRGGNLRQQFIEQFKFDPSTPTEEVEMTVPQALMLMNNETLAEALKSTGRTPLASILRDYPNDMDAARALYLQILGRRPTNDELAVCIDHVCAAPDRGRAYEDVAWVLVNSTEFRVKR